MSSEYGSIPKKPGGGVGCILFQTNETGEIISETESRWFGFTKEQAPMANALSFLLADAISDAMKSMAKQVQRLVDTQPRK